ncbi:sensor histidine kinase [Roseicella aquatilis]|uniref:histidine kinase n=1 Tax=Roseicella aquatilis TaxID=2527868 RepID=A0A4R4DA81_9PROT|nr:HAMP domain-containing sensor histidine kinase [Roseicella aquatilis]TCZ56761.1 HAMP domain-containing histidine kinase [Roseicella aquatilis]
MSEAAQDVLIGQLERELAYYRRECNDLGARLLRLQEEQSQTFREARRSRTVVKLTREAYRLADGDHPPDEIGVPMLEIIIENALCDGAALLQVEPDGETFRVTHAIGAGAEGPRHPVTIPSPPEFFFTTARTPMEPLAYGLTGILRLPYILWAHDRHAGRALILGNRSESNVSRPFEAGDQEFIEAALSVYIDLMLRKETQFALRGAMAAAERASAARARFLATLTHELRTPLNAIIGYSEMMVPGSRYDPAPADRGRYMELILEAAQYLLKLSDGILDYSYLEQALPSLAPEWLPAEEMLVGTAALVSGEGRSRGVVLRAAPIAEGLELCIDPLRFRQVLHNLLGNAVKFTGAGGLVEVMAETTPDGGAAVIVRDSGVGMQPQDIPRALEPFQQLDPSASRSFGGAGLGLPIARRLVEAHGGELLLESVPGQGTTATIRLPPSRVRLKQD